MTSPGNRYVTLKVCDNIGNCATKEVKFKIDTESPIVKYIGRDSSNNNYVKFQCESLSGVKVLQTADSNNGTVSTTNSEIKHYWGTSNNRPTIGITCRSNANTYANYNYKNVAKSTTSSYRYCGYVLKQDAYYNGSQTNNPCSTTTYVCNGTQKLNTNCYTNGTTKYFEGIGTKPILYYYQWGWYTATTTETSYYEALELINTGSD